MLGRVFDWQFIAIFSKKAPKSLFGPDSIYILGIFFKKCEQSITFNNISNLDDLLVDRLLDIHF